MHFMSINQGVHVKRFAFHYPYESQVKNIYMHNKGLNMQIKSTSPNMTFIILHKIEQKRYLQDS